MFDKICKTSFATLLEQPYLSDRTWKQAQLIQNPGLGLCSAESTRELAFARSWISFFTTIPKNFLQLALSLPSTFDTTTPFFRSINEANWLIITSLGTDTTNLTSDDTIKLQRKVALVAHREQVFKFLEDSSLTDKARLMALFAPGVGNWLKAILFEWELSLRDLFLPALRLYLRLELSASLPSECLCETQIDKFGIHLLTCRFGGGAILRHDVMRNEVAVLAKRVSFLVAREPHLTKGCMDLIFFVFQRGWSLFDHPQSQHQTMQVFKYSHTPNPTRTHTRFLWLFLP